MDPIRALVVTVSDRCANGSRDDLSGPRLCSLLTEQGYEVTGPHVVPDGKESVAGALQDAVDRGFPLVLTTGGTGVSPRDLTPEGTRAVITRELPGLAEAMRREGERHTPMAVLSRGVCGVIDPTVGVGTEPTTLAGGTLVINMPGNTKAIDQEIGAVLPLLPHVLHQLAGGDHG